MKSYIRKLLPGASRLLSVLIPLVLLAAAMPQIRADDVIVTKVAAGYRHSLLVKSDGTLWATGYNNVGQFGNGTTIDANRPVQVATNVATVAAGYAHSLLIKSDGTLWATGYNGNSELGDGTNTNRKIPVQVATNVSAVAAGDCHSLFVESDGTLWAMGLNNDGQLGDATTIGRSTPVRVALNVTAVTAGDYHSLFVKSDGTLWAMGNNEYGQLGDGSTTKRSTPVQVATNVTAVAAGSSHSLFVKNDGTLWAMGRNNYGQLGDNSNTNRSTPVQVATNVTAVTASSGHSLFIKSDGTLWATGYNASGQLGDGNSGSITNRKTPVQIATNVSAVAAGSGHSLFVKSNGMPWGMGRNNYGQLGDGSETNRATPVYIIAHAPGIITQPVSQTAGIGQNAVFTISVEGGPAPALQWQSSPNGSTWADISGATSTTLTIVAVITSMSGSQYRCVATNSLGGAISNTATLTVIDAATAAAQQLKTALEASGTATVTVSGSINLSLVGGATVTSAKTITGADASSGLTGSLTLTSGAKNTVILGVSFTSGTIVINGASDVDVSHCTFTDTPVSITGGSDNIAFAWNKFGATSAGTGSAMTITNAGSATGILLEHNYFADGLKADIPAVTSARVLMFNNYITTTGNTTATIAGAGAQILSVRNIYQGVNNPVTKESGGLVRVIGNFMNSTTGITASGEDEVFVPSYSHVMNPAGSNAATLATLISTNAGNTAGKNSATPAQTNGTASITVSGAVVTSNSTSAAISGGGGFTLTANATGFTPTTRQWYLDNFPLGGATGSTHAVTNATAATDAGAYSVALTANTGEIVTSAAFTVNIGALAAPVITAHPASQTITAGGSVTFGVTATGESLSYQWLKGGAAISGATGASYTITNAQSSHAGDYTVRVSNSSGTVTSNAATLTVNPSGGGSGGGGDNNNGGSSGGGSDGEGSGGGGGGAPSLLWLCALGSLLALRAAKRR